MERGIPGTIKHRLHALQKGLRELLKFMFVTFFVPTTGQYTKQAGSASARSFRALSKL